MGTASLRLRWRASLMPTRRRRRALLTMCQTMLSPEATQIGSYRGLTLELSFDTFAREYRLTMIGQLRHTVTLGTDVFGNLQRMDNALEGLPIKEQACREQLSNLQTQLETAKAEVQKPFPREAELNTKMARLEELNSLLNLDHKEPEIVDAEPRTRIKGHRSAADRRWSGKTNRKRRKLWVIRKAGSISSRSTNSRN